MTTPRPASPDITLANGRAVTCTRQPNGSQDARMADGGTMSTAAGREWDELHAAAVKNADISLRILSAIEAGATVPAAFDAVLGVGTHARLAGELYDEMRIAATA